MNKTRLENLSDGVFAIVFTLLVLDIRVPESLLMPTSNELWNALIVLAPVFLGYLISFVVLTMFWMAHTYFFSEMVKMVNRQLVGLNMLYLAAVGLIPFSAYLLGRYSHTSTAVIVYGVNVLLIGLLAAVRLEYAVASSEINTNHNEPRLLAQARVRTYMTVVITALGIAFVPISVSVALFLYAFPIIFNIIPGLLNKAERIFGFRLGS